MLNIVLGAVSLGLLWAIMTLGVFLTYRIFWTTPTSQLVGKTSQWEPPLRQGSFMTEWTLFWLLPLPLQAVWQPDGCTGVLHTKLKIPGLLSGILSMIALYSINIRIMGKANITLLKSDTVFAGYPAGILGITGQWAVMLVGAGLTAAVIFFLYWFFGTELGCAIRATGDNEKMARAQGINTDTMKLLGLMLSNGLVAFSGALIAQNQRYADITMGQGAIVVIGPRIGHHR